jgi:fluoride exporter
LKQTVVSILLVGAGGFVGAVCRYGLGGFVQARSSLSTFPFGTVTVNLLGCLLIGVAAGLVDTRQLFSPEFRTFAMIGVLGGFTTYSTFGYETFALLRDADYPRALAYVGVHVVIGLAMVWAGYNLTTTRWT